jgi:signal transduction histidine kinase
LLKAGPERFYPPDQFKNRSVEESIQESFEKTLAGHTMAFERAILNARGTNLTCEVRLSHLPSKNRRLIRLSYLDITERKRAEEERKKLEAQLLQSQKMEAVGQLAGGVAHDFNNLLTVILGYGEIMIADFSSDSPLYENLEEILAAGRRAQDLTRQLLAFSRKQVLEVKDVSLNEVVANMEKMIRRLLGEDIAVYLYLDADTGCVRADVSQLEQVLLNLCVNARDAMPAGGTLTIETHSIFFSDAYVALHPDVQPGPHAVLSVSDTGHGMDETTRRQIFDPFFSTKEKGKGTGLGLATVHGIVKQHGGEISVYSEPGHGSTFKVSLPQVEDVVFREAIHPEDGIVMGRGETILVVEDDASVRKILSQLLERLGYSVRMAGSVDEGIVEVRRAERIDLLLSDVIMPQMNGRQFSERVQSLRPEIKVLFMSGYTEEAIGHQGILESGLHFISKPFTEKALSRKIREALGG